MKMRAFFIYIDTPLTSSMKHFTLYFLTALLVLSCSHCKEQECTDSTNPDCPNYVAPTPVDPCAGSQEVSADFTIEEHVSYLPNLWRLTTNGVFSDNTLRIRPLNDNVNCKWILGVDTIQASEYSFHFPTGSYGQTFPIKLIVTGSIDTVCFPNDNGMDTITKYITVYDSCQMPIIGKYRVAWDSAPTDSFDVKLTCNADWIDGIAIYAQNFEHDQANDSCRMDFTGYGYNYYSLHTGLITCRGLIGEFWLNPDNSFEAKYKIRDGNWNYQNKHVHGRRIY
jgi:hypothetical protein